jgi:hypothetical protein
MTSCDLVISAYLKHLKANNIDTGLLMQQIEDVIIKVRKTSANH